MQTMVTNDYEIFFPKNFEKAVRIMLSLTVKNSVTQNG